MACRRCEISTYIKDNGVDLFFLLKHKIGAQGDEAKTVNRRQNCHVNRDLVAVELLQSTKLL